MMAKKKKLENERFAREIISTIEKHQSDEQILGHGFFFETRNTAYACPPNKFIHQIK